MKVRLTKGYTITTRLMKEEGECIKLDKGDLIEIERRDGSMAWINVHDKMKIFIGDNWEYRTKLEECIDKYDIY